MCSCVPTATVWRWPVAKGALSASRTVSVTSPPTRITSQTVTDVGVTLRSIGPARTRGLLPSEFRSDVQAMGYLLKQTEGCRTRMPSMVHLGRTTTGTQSFASDNVIDIGSFGV